MTRTLMAYEEALAQCVCRVVDSAEFVAAARAAKWDERTIELAIRRPLLHEFAKVGKEALLIRY